MIHDQPLPPPAKLVSGFGINRGPPSITPPQRDVTDAIPRESFGVNDIPTATVGATGYSR